MIILSVLSLLPLSKTEAQNTDKNTEAVDKIARIESIVNKLPDISGFVNLRYQFTDEKGKYDGFDVRRAYLTLKGKATQSLSYKLQVDFAGTPKILDAYAEWKAAEFFSLQAGQFKLPFSLENPYSPLNLETSDNSQIIDNLASGTKDVVSSNGRDIGLQASGKFFKQTDFSLLEYKVGVFNGAGINTTENNSTKDFAGTLFINPFKTLTISGSLLAGRAKINNVNQTRNRFGFGLKYEDKDFLLRSEFIKGKDASTKKDGFYVVGGYYVVPETLQLVLKYDTYDKNLDADNDKTTNYTIGLNYRIIKDTYLQINYVKKDNQAAKTISYAVAQLFIAF